MTKLTFLGATQTVTGSKYLLEFDTKRVLIDCGLFQGFKELRLRNWAKLPIDPKTIDAVILTHAHIDHSGYLPLLAKNGFKGPIYATRGTTDLCSILLPDSGHIQEEDAFFANKYGFSKHKVALPLYTEDDAYKVLDQFVELDYHQEQKIGNAIFSFFSAGHILGASFVSLSIKNKKIVFSGDMGRPNDPIIDSPEKIEEADYLVLESTYGDRLHEAISPYDQLKAIINDTFKRGGKLIIPAFAVGRTQTILYYIHQLKLKHEIPNMPVFVDSPMATRVTKLLDLYVNEHRLSKKECHDVTQTASYVSTIEESKKLDSLPVPAIIISASGMATGGRVLHHLKIFAPHARNTILFTGFQSGGTRGARILNGEREVKIHGEMIPIKAKVVALNNISAHADYSEILNWLSHFKKKPGRVFITHGEEQASLALKEKIENNLHWNCVLPKYQDKFEL